MTTDKHAPGPWWISDNHSDMRPEAIHCAGCNAIVATTWSIVPEEMRKANARLIAAAPSMLAALRQLLDDDNPLSDYNSKRDARAVAREVIAKATGI